jgi:hypothetical protein
LPDRGRSDRAALEQFSQFVAWSLTCLVGC